MVMKILVALNIKGKGEWIRSDLMELFVNWAVYLQREI